MSIISEESQFRVYRFTYFLRLDVQNSLVSIGPFASCLLSQVAHWSTFVEQPQLSVLADRIPWVPVDASIQHCPVEIADQASNVAS